MTLSQKKLQAAQAEVNRLWKLMCEADGIAPYSNFVVFSNSNPYNHAYNKAMVVLIAARKRERHNSARRIKHAVLSSMGLTRVVGACGGVYYE